MYVNLKISEEELGRFILAYNRGVFPKSWKLGQCFSLFYSPASPYSHTLRGEIDDNKAMQMIVDEFVGVLG